MRGSAGASQTSALRTGWMRSSLSGASLGFTFRMLSMFNSNTAFSLDHDESSICWSTRVNILHKTNHEITFSKYAFSTEILRVVICSLQRLMIWIHK